MRFLWTLWLFTFMAVANMDIYPKQECELFNNLKHTKNRGHEVLQLDRPYEMLKHHKGQYLVKVEGATPSQRWVDDNCLSLKPLRGTPIYNAMHNNRSKPIVKKQINIDEELHQADKHMVKEAQKRLNREQISSKQNLLALSWHNAFCETHRYKKECKRGITDLLRRKKSETQFVLHGLWPQPRNNVYCHVQKEDIEADKNKRWRDLPPLSLDAETINALKKIMPGFSSGLHKHEWIKHGTCYGTDANSYYQDAIHLLQQLNTSPLGKFFTQNIGKKITLKQIQMLANKSFGKGAGSRISLQCNRGLVTELWLHLGSGSRDLATLLKRGKPARSRCKGGYIDKAGFTKKNNYRTGFGR